MKPISFPEANSQLLAGGIPDCGDLPVFKDGSQIVSKWKMTWRERFSALFHGTAFVYVFSSRTSPPIAITVAKQVFTATEPKE